MGVKHQKPYLKWAGGKYKLLDKILPHLEDGKRLIEPFAGSAVVSLNSPNRYIVNDVNPDVHAVHYGVCRDDLFLHRCQRYFTPYSNTPDVYYKERHAFNSGQGKRAEQFIYLNRHGYNGLCRYNQLGEFNVPFGRYKKPYFPEREMIEFRSVMSGCKFHSKDWTQVIVYASRGDVVYFDPPYAPLTSAATFTEYAGGKFTEKEQRRLAYECKSLQKRGVKVVISNHDTPFTRHLYRGARIVQFEVQRSISCDSKKRTKAPELIAVFE